MKQKWKFSLAQPGLYAVILCAAFATPAARAQSGPVVWTTPALSRVGPSDPAGTGTTAQLEAGRGESESFQIVVKAPAGNTLTNVNVSVTDLAGPAGATIPKSNLTLYREYFVNITTSSPAWSGSANMPGPTGWYADGLIPFNDPVTGAPLSGATLTAVPFAVNNSQNQPIWVDVFVPRGTPAGQYTGSYMVTSGQGSVTGQIALTVWNFTLPAQPALRSSFQFWTAGNTPANEELLRARLQPMHVPASAQSPLLPYGFRDLDLGYWSGANISTCSMSAAPSVSQIQSTVSAQQPGLGLFNYSADEVGACTNLYTTLQQWGYNLHQAGVNQLVTMAPVPQLLSDGSGTGRSAVDIWVVLPDMYDANTSAIQNVLTKGDQVWSYNTLVQDAYSPKWEIDFAPINFRIQPGFINESLNLNGVLYWRVDLWTSDPWNNVYGISGYPGDGQLVYPGSTVGIQGVAPSMRLKWLRDGADDYDYIELLKAAGQGTWALQLAKSVGANWSTWTRDPNVLMSVRHQMGAELDLLGGGSTASNPPAAPSNPSPANGASSIPVTPVLSWTGSSTATSYDVYLGTSSNPAFVGTVSGTSFSPGTLANSTVYYWRVVAKNSAGSTSSATWAFTSQAAPLAAPGSMSPANGTTGTSTTPTLTWSASSGATSYDVYFGTASTPSLAINTTGTTYTPGTLQASTTYYWRIVAKNASSTATTATVSFTTAAAPPPLTAPASLSPANGTTGTSTTPTLSWSASSGATSYDVYFGTAATPSLAINTTGTTYTPGTLQASTTYYWRIVAKNASSTATTATVSFTTAAPPPPSTVPASVSPASGSGHSATFSFTFNNAQGYTNLAGGTVIINQTLAWSNACWIYYDRGANLIYLSSNNTSTWTSAKPGSATTLQNSQCTISASGASVVGSGASLTVNIPITFSSTFTGVRKIYMSANNSGTGQTPLTAVGTWTVQ